MEEISEKLKGAVEKITYKNNTNGYTVATIRVGNNRITAVGIMPFLAQGDVAEFCGKYTIHPSYGRQFSVSSFERKTPETAAAIFRYLSSGIIKGVGPGTASKIVERFGDKSLDIIQDAPNKLALIKGITIEKAQTISKEYSKQFGVRDIMLLLSPYEVSPETCVKIFRALGSEAKSIIKDNPYVLCSENIEFSFDRAEKIAYDFGIEPDNTVRLEAGIIYILRANLMNGHTCLPYSKLVAVAAGMLGSNADRISDVCDKLVANFKISAITLYGIKFIALNEYIAAEEYIAARLSAVNEHTAGLTKADKLEIEYAENKRGIKFEKIQIDAVCSALENGVFLLTGGPGTGKTTTLNAIIELLTLRNCSIILAAPTGRAAKRMTELTGMDAKTIHRLLEVEWDKDDKQHFAKNEKNPIDCDVLIVDEASMIDTLLFESLLRALRLNSRIILVGDVDQLPSVSAGNVFGDLIACEKFSTVRLKKVFRQSDTSLIHTNAYALINGGQVDFSNKGDDFFLLSRRSGDDVCNTVLELCTGRLYKTYGFDSLTDIQVLCPSKKLETGTVNLNNLLQSYLNPLTPNMQQLSFKGMYLRKDDKVMQIKNDYDISWEKDDGECGCGVFNGDVGFITEIDKRAQMLKVRFDDRVAVYVGEQIGELELAYAITVHKSQGSEFNCVIIPLFDIPSQLRYRNLLYTAVTRAKKMLLIVGSREVFEQMAANNKKTLRYTMLRYLLDENNR